MTKSTNRMVRCSVQLLLCAADRLAELTLCARVLDMLAWPDSIGSQVFFVICFPMLLAFRFSILDVRKARWTSYYPVTMVCRRSPVQSAKPALAELC